MYSTLILSIVLSFLCLYQTSSFRSVHNRPYHIYQREITSLCSSDVEGNAPKAENIQETTEPVTKGFGKPKPKVEVEKDAGTLQYEKQAGRGVPEYNIFLRPSGGSEVEWVPVGSMTIPRDVKVSKAVYEVEAELLKGTFKLFPKLKLYYQTKSEETKANAFEYGYILKQFPDEEIKVIIRDEDKASKKNFFSNWLERLTNPIDTTDIKNPGQITLK